MYRFAVVWLSSKFFVSHRVHDPCETWLLASMKAPAVTGVIAVIGLNQHLSSAPVVFQSSIVSGSQFGLDHRHEHP
jgi:hypothetical protein